MASNTQSSERPAERSHTRAPAGYFVTTRWSVVLAAGREDPDRARDALSVLCQTYWFPLYAFLRRRGYSPADAEDLTQDFFARLIEKETLARLSPDKGRFRSFLLATLNHFLLDQHKRAKAQKRGALKIISLDAQQAETRYRLEPVENATAETIFEQNWALALLDRVIASIAAEFEASGKGGLFEQLKFCLTTDRSTVPYGQLAVQLRMSEAGLRVAIHRLRRRYRELLRSEVAQTVSRPEEIESELRHLARVLARSG